MGERNHRRTQRRFGMLLVIVLMLAMSLTVYANSAKPPDLIVILDQAPEDIEISLTYADQIIEGMPMRFQGREYVAFDYLHIDQPGMGLMVRSQAGSYDLELSADALGGYEKMVVLHYPGRTVHQGNFTSRTVLLVMLRVGLTLLIEGGIFWLFGYRKGRYWAAFVLVNLATQGALNIGIVNADPFRSYLFFTLIIWEVLIILFEALIYKIVMPDQKRVILYAVTANLCSWFIGWQVLDWLPI